MTTKPQPTIQTMYLVKGFMTTGKIEPVTVEYIQGYSHVKALPNLCPVYYKLGHEIFPTKEEAAAAAENLLKSKIKSLEKQLDKLKAFVID